MKQNYTLKKKTLKFLFVFLMINFICVKSFSQTINFTIDTAIDNGTTITETIIDGIDTYVLTIDHLSDNEALDDLGGGDLVFFLGSRKLTPFIVSLTKNGTPYSFTLNGLDYDTAEAGNILLKNQDDLIIAASITYPLGAGTIVISNPTNAVDISNFKIIPADDDDLNDFGFHNVNVTVGSVLGIDDLDLNNQVLMYPNPSSGKIAIKSSGNILQNIQISDLKGRVVANYKLEGITNTKEINLSKLSSGVYLVNINSDKGSVVKKLIIE